MEIKHKDYECLDCFNARLTSFEIITDMCLSFNVTHLGTEVQTKFVDDKRAYEFTKNSPLTIFVNSNENQS